MRREKPAALGEHDRVRGDLAHALERRAGQADEPVLEGLHAYGANRAMLEGKRVILVDDSIVRGTTSTKIVEMVRQAGATEVHMRISSPPTTNSCFYGIDTPERSKLLASSHSVDEMADLIGADSLAFISIDGLYRALGKSGRDPKKPYYCDACFTGDYPIPLPDQQDNADRQLSLLVVNH